MKKYFVVCQYFVKGNQGNPDNYEIQVGKPTKHGEGCGEVVVADLILDTENESDSNSQAQNTRSASNTDTKTGTDTETETEAEKDTETELDIDTEKVIETDMEKDTETVLETDTELETDTDKVIETDVEKYTETELDTTDTDKVIGTDEEKDTETELETDTDKVIETDMEKDTETELDTDTDKVIETDMEKDTETELDTDTEKVIETDVEKDTETEMETDTDKVIETDEEKDTETDTETEIETELETEADKEVETGLETNESMMACDCWSRHCHYCRDIKCAVRYNLTSSSKGITASSKLAWMKLNAVVFYDSKGKELGTFQFSLSRIYLTGCMAYRTRNVFWTYRHRRHLQTSWTVLFDHGRLRLKIGHELVFKQKLIGECATHYQDIQYFAFSTTHCQKYFTLTSDMEAGEKINETCGGTCPVKDHKFD